MLKLFQMNIEDIKALKKNYDALPKWYAQLFFPAELAAALKAYPYENESTEKSWPIYSAFINSQKKGIWFLQSWFFSCLNVFSKSSLVSAVIYAHKEGLLEGDVRPANFNVIAGHRFASDVVLALLGLKKAGYLEGEVGQANREALVQDTPEMDEPTNKPRKRRDSFIGALEASHLVRLKEVKPYLSTIGLEDLEGPPLNRDEALLKKKREFLQAAKLMEAIEPKKNSNPNMHEFTDQRPCTIAKALIMAYQDGLIGDKASVYRDIIAKHNNPIRITEVLIRMKKDGLLLVEDDKANREAVVNNPEPDWAAYNLIVLYKAGLLLRDKGQVNREVVCVDAYSVANALLLLQLEDLLKGETAQANLDAVVGKELKDPVSRARILLMIHAAGLLAGEEGQANRDKVAGLKNPGVIADLLRNSLITSLSNELAQDTFNSIIRQVETCIFKHGEAKWRRFETAREMKKHFGEAQQAFFSALEELRSADVSSIGASVVSQGI